MNMDEETKAAFAALMQRMNDGFEHVADRMSAVERQVNELGKRIDGLTEIARTTNTLLSTVAGLLTDFGRRITDLEKK
jgi:hypothetical protein